MEGCYSLCSFSTINTPFSLSKACYSKANSIISRWWCMSMSMNSMNMSSKRSSMEAASAFPYKKFINFALEETNLHTHLVPSPLQEKFGSLTAIDGKTELQMLAFEAPKIRLLRALSVEGSDGIEVLDFAVFPKPEFDLPIFCANFFTANNTNIIVLDLNPLHDVTSDRNYLEKYYKNLIPLGVKYSELLPWGGKLTSESLQFFSPIIIWTKFSSSQDKYDALFSAFKDYYKAWLELMHKAAADTEISQITRNSAAHHKYLTWRAEKDPGHRVLTRLVGESLAKEVIRDFLFSGVLDLGTKTFLDYFPEYKCEDGSVNEKRSMSGRSFENRPWDTRGEFIGDSFRSSSL